MPATIDKAKGFLQKGKNFTPQGQIARRTYNTAKKLAVGTGAIFAAMLTYFYTLGAAAFKGFLMGAAVGGTAGAITGGVIGFQIGVALAPFTFGLSIPVFTGLGIVTGAAVGATIGGVTGGLIALGLASGSATAISMGVGAGIGGTIGAVAGYFAGAAVGGALVAGCAALFAPCLALAPIVVPLSGAIGGIVGGYVGAAIGAAVGYAIGHYVLDPLGAQLTGTLAGAGVGATAGFFVGGPFGAVIGAGIGAGIGWLSTGGYSQVKEFFSSTGEGISGGTSTVGGAVSSGTSTVFGAISSGIGAIGSTVTGIAASTWNGIVSGAGAAVGGIANAAGGLVGAIGEVSISSSLVAVPVVAAVGTITAASMFIGVNTSTSFFDPKGDSQLNSPGSPPGGPPVEGCPSGWPTTGNITQGPEAGSHLTPLPNGNEGIDIGTNQGTLVYATVSGTILYHGGAGSNQELAIKINPACDGPNTGGGVLEEIYYFHLSSVCATPFICYSPGDPVPAGAPIGRTGQSNNFDHLHYQFNRSNTPRTFQLEAPYIPQNVTRNCSDLEGRPCNINITSAP